MPPSTRMPRPLPSPRPIKHSGHSSITLVFHCVPDALSEPGARGPLLCGTGPALSGQLQYSAHSPVSSGRCGTLMQGEDTHRRMRLDTQIKCSFFWEVVFCRDQQGLLSSCKKKKKKKEWGRSSVVAFFLFPPHETCMRWDDSRCVLFMQTAESYCKYCKWCAFDGRRRPSESLRGY